MKPELPLFPEAASSVARDVDLLYLTWASISLFFTVLIGILVVYFVVRYRRTHPHEVGARERTAMWLEVTWSVIPLVIVLVMFVWGTRVYFKIYRPPADAVEYTAVGKQWMWKFQHPDGQREINTLHVPVGQPIKLKLTSEDVIHSFFVPAFRVKQDAVPGRYTSVWFEPTKPGRYHLFCAEYCGGEHSKMIGWVIAMDPHDYEAWLAGGVAGKSLVASGEELFQTLACDTCHRAKDTARVARGPALEGLYGSEVTLKSGGTVTADDTYLRESIVNPMAKIVAGWDPVMPTFQGQVSEEQLTQLIAYIQSLGAPGAPVAAAQAPLP